jgi:hypothetical protein
MTGVNQVLKICWEIVNRSRNINNDNNGQTVTTMTDNKTVLQALALINDCNKYKMDLTTNDVVITDAVRLVQANKEILMFAKEEDKESKEPKYDEDKDQLGKRQEEKTEEPSQDKQTTNQVF